MKDFRKIERSNRQLKHANRQWAAKDINKKDNPNELSFLGSHYVFKECSPRFFYNKNEEGNI